MKNKKSFLNLLVSGKMAIKALLPITAIFMCFSVFAQEPQKPLIDSISIVDGHPFITWFPNTDNTEEYVIVRKIGNSPSFEIATVPGISSTSYHDIEVIACDNWYGYNVFASDEGQPDSPWSDTLRTIFLGQPQLNICGNFVTLQWSDYVNMVSSLSGYQVWASENGGNFELLTPAPLIERNFTHNSLSSNTLYTYKVMALNQDGSRTSSTCEVSIRSKTYAKPAFAHVLYASVENNDHIQLAWESDPSADISRYVIKRSDAIEFDIPEGSSTKYSDTSADFNSRSYDYSVVVFDSCDFEVLETDNIGRTMYLQWQPGNAGLAIELNWNAYEAWADGVDRYNIFRKMTGSFTQIGSVGSIEISYSDDVSGLTGSEGIFTYYVEAVEKNGNLATSISNQVVIEMETKVLVPNAFIPEGLPPDNEFKPVTSFIDRDTYELLIFNKWGQMIFSTKDSESGWDGKFNGDYVPADAYVYRIKVKSPDGRDFQKQGTVTVIR